MVVGRCWRRVSFFEGCFLGRGWGGGGGEGGREELVGVIGFCEGDWSLHRRGGGKKGLV